MFRTYEEVMNYCSNNNIMMIDFKMIDLLGRWRHLSIPTGRFKPDTRLRYRFRWLQLRIRPGREE